MLGPPFERIRVGPARMEDLDRILAILGEAAGWLRARGLDQWPLEMPGRIVLPGLTAGNCHLAWDDGVAVGTLTLQDADETFWGERPPDAFYLHRLAVSRSHRGLGRELLEWAEAATRSAGRSFLRLDCMSDNPGLRAFYERAGYLHRGDVDGWGTSLYEREVGGPRRR
ncbi:MAG TPA: GNAT family N-acetyltransferase [Candidatus Dormibacteraeota bacterium]|jgi:GNAT superfamily N-acetyltransferase|nr:GNAT family N-acetyltransferase [Candidatus Dormibacteraeota bacterium]